MPRDKVNNLKMDNNYLYLNNLNPILLEQEIKKLPNYVFEVADHLYLDHNGLQEIPKWIGQFTNLISVNLSANRIRKLERLESLVLLQYLSIEGNHIKKIEGLDSLESLKGLLLGESHHYGCGNEISKIENLDSLKTLEVLELANNKIQAIEGLEKLKNLYELNLASNQITNVQGLNGLNNLKRLNLNDNLIKHLEVSELPVSEEIYLWGNPIESISNIEGMRKFKEINITLETLNTSDREKFLMVFEDAGYWYRKKK